MRNLPLAVLLLALPLAAQTRITVLVGPPALGATCYVRHVLPAGSVGHIAGFLWSGPFAGAVTVPGLAVNGLLRVDPAAFVALGLTLTNGVDLPSLALPVPASPSVLGSQLDCQSFDLDLATVFHLAGNDVALTVVDGPSAALNMVAIAPGTFLMGANNGAPDEQPVHPVTISRPFWISRFETTQAQYSALMGANPSIFQGPGFPNAAQQPVEGVSWNDAIAYCAALNAVEQAAGRVPAGYQYRLPTEAEWEYCCRAGTTTDYHTGSLLACSQAQFNNCPPNAPVPVGLFAPNAFGLHDMHGNLWEFCLDDWDFANNYPANAVTDPLVAFAGAPARIGRGGSWTSGPFTSRSAVRDGSATTAVFDDYGFRVVLAPVLASAPTASFTASATSGGGPLTVRFTNTSTAASSWQWDFQNDGVIDTTQRDPSFLYTANGTYSVRLVAIGQGGLSVATQTALVTVYDGPTFTAQPAAGAAPLTVQFAGAATFPVTAWNWDFQDDGVVDATTANPSCTYTANGAYSVRLTVTTTVAPFIRTTVRPAVNIPGPDAALGMVAIAPGSFPMGSSWPDLPPYLNQANAKPVHQVTISQPFWIGRHEVTQAQYAARMGSNPSFFQGAGNPNAAQRPVEQVTWNQAVAYCAALTASEQAAGRLPAGYVYRLPTEAEWEYCCRAGTTTEFHYGALLPCGQANFGFSFHPSGNCANPGGVQTAVVGSYAPNAWGLYDMHGNVWEWCHDRWDGSSNYPATPVTDPVGTTGPDRILRGGSWDDRSSECRSARRAGEGPGTVFNNFGFRIVLGLPIP